MQAIQATDGEGNPRATTEITCQPGPENYFGLTHGCRNSGENDRIGKITKAGSCMARWVLGQATKHILRIDGAMRAWFKKLKRVTKVARVAVMRRLTTSMWHMIKHEEPYMTYSQRQQPERLTFIGLPARRDDHSRDDHNSTLTT